MKTKRNIRKVSITIALLMVTISSSIAQDSCRVRLFKELNKAIAVDLKVFPDSTKLWTFALEINLENRGDSTKITSFKTNHPIGHAVNASFAALKKLNFTCIMDGKKRRALIIPFCIVIYGSQDENRKLLSLNSISQDLQRLFNNSEDTNDKLGILYRTPYIIHADKKVYD